MSKEVRTIREARQEIERLESDNGDLQTQIDTGNATIRTLTQERDKAKADANSEKERADQAEAQAAEAVKAKEKAEKSASEANDALAKARGDHETIEDRIASEVDQKAEAKALELSASRGVAPVTGDAGEEQSDRRNDDLHGRERMAAKFKLAS